MNLGFNQARAMILLDWNNSWQKVLAENDDVLLKRIILIRESVASFCITSFMGKLFLLSSLWDSPFVNE